MPRLLRCCQAFFFWISLGNHTCCFHSNTIHFLFSSRRPNHHAATATPHAAPPTSHPSHPRHTLATHNTLATRPTTRSHTRPPRLPRSGSMSRRPRSKRNHYDGRLLSPAKSHFFPARPWSRAALLGTAGGHRARVRGCVGRSEASWAKGSSDGAQVPEAGARRGLLKGDFLGTVARDERFPVCARRRNDERLEAEQKDEI